ncbi:MAG: ferritin [Planctomycetes bacterium]|nr:ferritin [Planctomycetota bacterium]
MANSVGFHESSELLPDATKDMHRALTSLQEELEATDWYRQRADVCTDADLKEILLHNMREEIEHAAMILEWLRRRSPDFDRNLRTYLFTKEPITLIEKKDGPKS